MPKARYYQPGPIRPHPKVGHKRLSDRTDQYSGQASDLIEAGVLQAHMLPPRVSIAWRPEGAPTRTSYVHRVPGYLTVSLMPGGAYRVVLTVSHEEQEARRAVSERKDEPARLEKQKKEVENARQSLGKLTASHEQFRTEYAGRLSNTVRASVGLLGELLGHDGFSMSDDTVAEFLDAFDEAVAVLRNGTSVFNRGKRAEYVSELRAKLARGDDQFQPFLARLLDAAAAG